MSGFANRIHPASHHLSILVAAGAALCIAAGSAAQSFSGTVDFDDLPTGPSNGAFGPMWLTGSWYPFMGDNDCGDLQAPTDGGRAVIVRFPGGDTCTDRHGIDVIQDDQQSRDGILGINFRPGWTPTTVGFEIRQHGGSGPVTVNAYGAAGSLLWSDAAAMPLWSVSISPDEPIARIEVLGSQPFTVDMISYAGSGDATAYDRLIDFEALPAGPFSGNFQIVHFTATDYGCSDSVGDSSAPGNGQRCLVCDGDNPRNAGPARDCGGSVTDRNGVAVAQAGLATDQPYARSFNGILTADFHPAARPAIFECGLRQYSVAGPVTVRARNACGGVVFEQTFAENSASVSIAHAPGLGSVEFEGEHPFAIDDVHLVSALGPGMADLDGDGDVDGADLGILLASWSECPQP